MRDQVKSWLIRAVKNIIFYTLSFIIVGICIFLFFDLRSEYSIVLNQYLLPACIFVDIFLKPLIDVINKPLTELSIGNIILLFAYYYAARLLYTIVKITIHIAKDILSFLNDFFDGEVYGQ